MRYSSAEHQQGHSYFSKAGTFHELVCSAMLFNSPLWLLFVITDTSGHLVVPSFFFFVYMLFPALPTVDGQGGHCNISPLRSEDRPGDI